MRILSLFLVLGLFCAAGCGGSKTETGGGGGSGDIAAGKAKFEQICAPSHGCEGKCEQVCATCQRVDGKGGGPAAAALNPKPRDYTNAAYMKTRTDDQLRKVIKEGGAASGFSPVMHVCGGTLSDQDITDVIAYIRTFSQS